MTAELVPWLLNRAFGIGGQFKNNGIRTANCLSITEEYPSISN